MAAQNAWKRAAATLVVFAGTVVASGATLPAASVEPYQLAGMTFDRCEPTIPLSVEYVVQVVRGVRASSAQESGLMERYYVSKYISIAGACIRESFDSRPSSEASTWELASDGSSAHIVGQTNYGRVDVAWRRVSDQPTVFHYVTDPSSVLLGPHRVVAGVLFGAAATGSLGTLYSQLTDSEAVLVPAGIDIRSGSIGLLGA